MSELGQLLKKARLEKGLTLDDVQEATKIRKRYLEAIEEGDYKVLPGSFYVRAFIKTYAETVGLNPDELLQFYRNDIPAPEVETTVEPMIRKKRRAVHSDKFGRWATTILMWAFLALIIVIVYFYVVNNKTPDNQTSDNSGIISGTPAPGQTTPGNGAQTPSTGSGGGTKEPETTAPPVEPEKEPIVVRTSANAFDYAVASPEAGKAEAEIAATGRSWISVREGSGQGKILFEDTVDADFKQTFEIPEAGLYFRSGRTDNTSITVFGQTLDDGNSSNNPTNVIVKVVSYEEAEKLAVEGGDASGSQ
ncbi:MAG: helix-turn-helix domain-containing protein [Paenibacillus dendritiformis]|uniref:helix-turn-helix domain-containing protein n=1 Tax=uncultured Paenibacillus sp. TaxID=227322 RepID=UPI0025E4D1B2|nr:RodZ family helix-turn-helix domain-containing protein [uncultured Paenibacillus sp.]MDU5142062.1 helix-turn-helix domain-containing protein [Paenibacillus dendritiformis]